MKLIDPMKAKALVRAAVVPFVFVAAIVLIGPLTYDDQAHQSLVAFSRQLSAWGGQLFGLDLAAPRQSIFSLARDLDRTVTVLDHAVVRSSRLIGLGNFITRGSVYTVAD